ncbi:MAG: hypothetical protein A3B29_00585 [Candidatus Sungbacteria bacterium RIFCSPLOWO2_01_FULL_51_34]|nr:MAG: hypothetical protein A3B29_00585 [Candidatus Sungbacteria bacterium RIFCSPLOWO2_01_FULL_51_34]
MSPPIEDIRRFIGAEARIHACPFLRAMRLVRDAAREVVGTAAHNAGVRAGKGGYWLLNNQDGLYRADMPEEIKRQVGIGTPSALFRDVVFPHWWQDLLEQAPAQWPPNLLLGLRAAIDEVATRYTYDAAYVGACNYCFSTLSVHIFFDVLGDAFSEGELWFLVWFWERVGKEFYATVAAPYEDGAIAKNGDCDAFIRARKIIAARQKPRP